MEVKKEITPLSNTEVYSYTLSNGIRCYVVPKKEYIEKQAMAVINFGSSNDFFEHNGENVQIPSGTAHFIEHVLFEKENENYFSMLSQNGAVPNAFTDHSKTAYYFSCRDDFYKNFKLLLNMISTPYFDNDIINKEKDIIKSEINMYNDIPERRVFSNLCRLMYPDTNTGEEIAGNIKTLEKITPTLLNKCYNAFYTPKNISVICCGDIEPKKTALIAQNTDFSASGTKSKSYKPFFKSDDYHCEDNNLNEKLFSLGFAHNSIDYKELCSLKTAAELICGKASVLYDNLVKNRYMISPFSFDTIVCPDKAFSVLSAKGKYPEKISKLFIKRAILLSASGPGRPALNRMKSLYKGKSIIDSSISSLMMNMSSLIPFNISLAEAEKTIMDMTEEDIINAAGKFRRNNGYLSIIK